MFNRSYQIRAVRQAGGGHAVAAIAASRLPWAGLFERPASPPETAARPKNAALGCKKRPGKKSTRQLPLFDGKLRGVQLSLIFVDEMPAQRENLRPEFPSAADLETPLNEDQLEADFLRKFPL